MGQSSKKVEETRRLRGLLGLGVLGVRGVRDVAGSSGLKDVHSMNDIDDAMVAINYIVDNEKAMRIPIGFGLAFAFD